MPIFLLLHLIEMHRGQLLDHLLYRIYYAKNRFDFATLRAFQFLTWLISSTFYFNFLNILFDKYLYFQAFFINIFMLIRWNLYFIWFVGRLLGILIASHKSFFQYVPLVIFLWLKTQFLILIKREVCIFLFKNWQLLA